MNRRHLASLVLVLAVALFMIPLVSPVQTQEPKLAVDTGDTPSKQPHNFTDETVRYQQLSPAAQQWFDSVPTGETIRQENIVPLDSPPEPWTTFVPNATDTTNISDVRSTVQVVKNDSYYILILLRITPKPPQQAVMMRLGPLVVSVGLFGLAGHLFLSAER